MTADHNILTDAELSLLRTRFMVNPEMSIDPEIRDRLLKTAEYYRDAVQQVAPKFPEQVRL